MVFIDGKFEGNTRLWISLPRVGEGCLVVPCVFLRRLNLVRSFSREEWNRIGTTTTATTEMTVTMETMEAAMETSETIESAYGLACTEWWARGYRIVHLDQHHNG